MKRALALLIAAVLLSSASIAMADVTLDYAMGEFDGTEYRNEFLGVGFTLDQSYWQYINKIQLLISESKPIESLDKNLKDILEESKSFDLMNAISRKGLTDISISIQDIGEMAALYQDYGVYNILASQIDSIQSSNGAVQVSVDEMMVDGKNAAVMTFDALHSGFPYYMTEIIFIKDEYMVYLTVTDYTGVPMDVFDIVFWIE